MNSLKYNFTEFLGAFSQSDIPRIGVIEEQAHESSEGLQYSVSCFPVKRQWTQGITCPLMLANTVQS